VPSASATSCWRSCSIAIRASCFSWRAASIATASLREGFAYAEDCVYDPLQAPLNRGEHLLFQQGDSLFPTGELNPGAAQRPAGGALQDPLHAAEVGWRDADDDQPVATAGRAADRAAVQVPAGDGNAGGDLFFQGGEAGPVGEAGIDAVTGQGLNLGRWA